MGQTSIVTRLDSESRLASSLARPPASKNTVARTGALRRILYVGDTLEGCTSGMRLETLRGLGHSVQAISRVHAREGRMAGFRSRVLWKLGYPRDRGVNQAILDALSQSKPDVLWCDRPVDVKPATLLAAKRVHPSMKIVAYSVDDMAQSHNQSSFYLRSIPLYDLHVTTKSYNPAELTDLGARRVLFVSNAFSPQVHFPVELPPEEKRRYGGPVGFVGTYERERAEMLVALAKEQIPVRVWGGAWPKRLRSATPHLRVEGRELMGDSYRLALNSFDVNLGFLRKINRDLQTTRFVEIPACGGFMLAERTEEHRALFQEDVEAAYFSSMDELIQKTKHYLQNEPMRKRIALNGFRKAATAHTYQTQLESVLARL
jgi:spore maturation protein CgeB